VTSESTSSRARASPPVLAALGLIAAVVAMGFFAANDFDQRAIHWGRMQVVLLFVLPLLPGVVLLAVRQLRSSGMAYAAGIGTVAALALAIPAGLLIIFLGASTPEQRVDTFALAGYMLAMLAVAVSAWIGYFRLPRDERRGGIAAVSLSGAALYVLFGWAFFQTATHRPYDRAALIRDYNDREARKTISAVAECARRQAASSRQRGYPADMTELFASGCLPGKLQLGQSGTSAAADGYAFYYYADPPDASGRVGRFAACARAGREEDGTLAIGIDTEGNLTALEAPAWKPARSCFAAWAGNDEKRYLNALAGCLMSAAALRPGHGYPRTLFDAQGHHAGACDFKPLEVEPTGRARTERGVIEYRPEPEVGGVIRGYRLALFPQSGGAPLEMDQLGRVQALQLADVAPTLAAVESARPAEALKQEALNARRVELMAACQSGNLAVCEDLGELEYTNDRPMEADRWWDLACEKGRLQTCLLSARYNPTTDPTSARSDKERCVQGEPRYCQRLEEEARALEARIEELRRRGGFQISSGADARIEAKRRELGPLCDAGNLELCENLGDIEWDLHNTAEAKRWWDRACEGGRLQACLLGTRFNPAPDRQPAAGLRDKCRQGIAGACRELEALVQALRPGIDSLLSKNRAPGTASRPER
jgi:hypothetical protein